MSDSNEPINPEENQELQAAPQLPILTIQMQPDGGVLVAGPIRDKILSYGMLEAAHDAIHEHHLEQKYELRKRGEIVKPNGNGIINFARNGFKHN